MGTSYLREAKSLPYGWRCENQGGGVSCSKYIQYTKRSKIFQASREKYLQKPYSGV